MSKLVCIIGKSGSGKTTICNELSNRYKYKAIDSYTTRPKRYPNEKGHTFVTDEEFKKLGKMVAYNETTGYKYGVTESMVEDENYSLYVVDFSGIKSLKENYKGNREIVSVYIDADSKELIKRLRKRYMRRHTNEAALNLVSNRIEHDKVEFDGAKEYCNIVISNNYGEFESAIDGIFKILEDKGD